VRGALAKNLDQLSHYTAPELMELRYRKFRAMGRFIETQEQ